ncbi:MAG: formate dehydrogenase accessory sulfurtransferase FdhD [Candidatus Adiutrix sp.]|jgi:FdhD protein|nr:formate dehydrogenase accessory sulfurtransferase FdhD [Candidatus Adiutrix sp.]
MPNQTQATIYSYRQGQVAIVPDALVMEKSINLIVNAHQFLTVLATPQHLEELALGILFSEGAVKSAAEVDSIWVNRQQDRVVVTLAREGPLPPPNQMLRQSGCGACDSSLNAVTRDSGAAEDDEAVIPRLAPQDIISLMADFEQRSSLFRDTGAVHSVCFVCPESRAGAIFYDDMGRHNALDKVIGRLLQTGQNPAGGLILTTGRVSMEILIRTHRTGCRFLVSRSAPTDKAVSLAAELGLTLVGFARGQRFNVYARPDRIWPEPGLKAGD